MPVNRQPREALGAQIDAANYLMYVTRELPADISHELLREMILRAYLRGRQDEAADREQGLK